MDLVKLVLHLHIDGLSRPVPRPLVLNWCATKGAEVLSLAMSYGRLNL